MDDASSEPAVMPLDFLREITNGFSEERKLGSGSFGKVYLGVHPYGEKIAVKMLYDMPGLDDEQFQNEFKILTRLEHQNIVRLVGYCHDIQEVQVQHQGRLVLAEKTHRALCLEYMSNGSLDKYLSDECDRYDWQKGYRMIKGICQGLNYLHNEIKPPIYHLDLKPANVLLDENMIPRISDFGMSRLFGDEQTRTTKSSLGTIGYLPPEYITQNVVSSKFDIFSLGVVIIKIMAGRAGYFNIAHMSSQEFTTLVQENWTNRLLITSNRRNAYSEQVKICIEIGLSCVQEDRHKRPTIQDIVDRLKETETKCNYASRKDWLLIFQALLLSDLNTSLRRVTVRARVARVWEFYKENNELAHVDLVFIDEQGNKMYGEVQAMHAEVFREKFKEGNVCLIKDFFVNTAKNKYKVVEGSFMMKITSWSKVEVQDDVPVDYPRYAYSLTDFKILPSLIGKTDSFIDVIGILSAISDILKVRVPGRAKDSDKRNLQITDIDGNIMDVALWGDHATGFEADDLYDRGQTQPIIILLVGTLMKSYLGRPTISCCDAAKVYINPDIPEKKDYCDRLGEQMPALRLMSGSDDQYNAAYNRDEPETVAMALLNSTDPNDFLGKNMISTVTITRLASEHWWFLSCQLCHKKAFEAANAFVCSNKRCNCTTATPRYKVRVIGADKTGEVEFVLFATVAEQVIGKRLEVVMHNARPFIVPEEISALISQKFTINFTVNERGLQYGQLSFQVNSVTETHKKTNVFEFNKLTSGSSSTSTQESRESSKVNNTTQKDGTNETEKNEMHTSPIVTESPALSATGNTRNQDNHSTNETEGTPVTAGQETPNDRNAPLTNTSTSTNKKYAKRTATDTSKTSGTRKKQHLD